MANKDSTILVMGPRGAGKSKFIELLAGPTKLRPNGAPVDGPRMISISPFFTDGKTTKLVKFPGFDKSDTKVTDAELFIGIATFLGSHHLRREEITSIIYLHPVDRSKEADVGRNITMFRKIVQGAEENIVVVTTGGVQTQNADGDDEESPLPHDLKGDGLEGPLGYDGTTLSALIILETARKKNPIQLDLKNKIPQRTEAGKELTRHIDELRKSVRGRDEKLDKEIAKEANDVKQRELEAKQTQLKAALRRLDEDRKKLGASTDLEQANKDNDKLKGVINERRDSAKNWRVEYENLMNKYNEKVVAYKILEGEKSTLQTEKNALQTEKSALQTEKAALQTDKNTLQTEKAALQTKKNALETEVGPLRRFSVPIKAKQDYGGYGAAFIPFKTGDQFHTTAEGVSTDSENKGYYPVRDSKGHFGVLHVSQVTK